MNLSELKNIVENAIIAKVISQRKLDKLSRISRSTLTILLMEKLKK